MRVETFVLLGGLVGCSPTPLSLVEQRATHSPVALTAARTQVAACLRDPIAALQELGERDKAFLVAYGVRKCGGILHFLLTNEYERSTMFTDMYVLEFVQQEIGRISP